MRNAFLLPITVAMALISPAQAERLVSCPDYKVKGCDVFTDPIGNPISPKKGCPISHCRDFEPKIVDGKKYCPFNCPEYFEDR